MGNIKTKDSIPKSVKTLDKAVAWTERVKDPIVYANEKLKEAMNPDNNIIDYGSDRIEYVSNRAKDESIYAAKKGITKTKEVAINKYKKKKLLKDKTGEKAKKGIKTSKNALKNTDKIAKDTTKLSKKIAEQGRKLAIESAKKAAQGTKAAIKATLDFIKGIMVALKSLISLLAAGGFVVVIAVVVICLVGLLVSSIFGIFFSSEKTTPNGITMTDVIIECNQEFNAKLETIQAQTIHDEYILEGNMASWKDILIIYSVKQSKGINEQEVLTLDNNKKQIVKQIFWDMNEVSYEVKSETVQTSKVDTSDTTRETAKQVLHIYVKSKTANEMTTKYNFNSPQMKQFYEISNSKYANLWSNVIYGAIGNSKFVSWRQRDPLWANVKMGNSTGTIGSIGCLVTSVSILIEKSGCNDTLIPFNPGTFVEALNKNGGFDSYGNLQYAAITKVVPKFKFVGKVDLRGKSKEEKLFLIKQYLNAGYYITAEVKGATPGNQHWVAVLDVVGNNVMMVDPGTNQNIMWNAYNYTKTSQFNYFKVEG